MVKNVVIIVVISFCRPHSAMVPITKRSIVATDVLPAILWSS